ncbi:GGDEF domain-containing protein [Sporosarcina sp. YIM B06819]|uniref:GGDEF domain-containing protein n=1 Tax=Sporosarcina sp. YIM B06819 TaxID=3081769 RepID=UPI00298D550C|nr:GGDEF domain-containing protein [Sporosarcina sp. YIM B06819]
MPPGDIDWLLISLYFIILVITMLMPMRLSNVTISLERWITFTVFFQFGVFAELVFMQIAMIILLFSGKTSTPTLQRFLINSSMFALVSISSALVFHGVGGEIGITDFSSFILFGIIYAITYMVINSLLLKLFFAMLSRRYAIKSRATVWDYVTTMLVFPFTITLYYLNLYVGIESILLCGIPFLFILRISRIYHRSDNLNDKLASASVIGRELADRLVFEDVIRTFIVKLRNVVSYENAYVLDVRTGAHLIMLMGYENNQATKNVKAMVFQSKILLDNGLDMETTRIFNTKKDVGILRGFEFSPTVKSVMTAPIKRNKKTEGFLILTSNHKNMFHALDMKIVDMLTGYFAVSLLKARLYEKTVEQSERCGLTKLHNFRYLDEKLDEEIIRYHTGEISSLSAIILDIDYFKSINDTYGHQSGNDLLCALATVLRTYVDPGVTLARYGGEEFVFIVPNKGKKETIELAEEIRKEIATTVFRIIPDLSEDRSPMDVRMTLSIGVATVPEDAEDAKLLLRNADRALYIGGKQAGRNRVGVFSREEIMTV